MSDTKAEEDAKVDDLDEKTDIESDVAEDKVHDGSKMENVGEKDELFEEDEINIDMSETHNIKIDES